MKTENKMKKAPSFLAYLNALALQMILAFALSFAYHADQVLSYGNYHDTYAGAGELFCVFLLASLVFGRAVQGVTKGALKDDTLVINDTSYAGTFAPYYILPALFSFETLNKKLAYLKDGIKKQHSIGTMDFVGPLQVRVPTPTQSGGNLVIDKRQLIPQNTMVYQEFNPRDLESHWESENLSETLLTRQLPATVENYAIMLFLGRAMEQFDIMTWQGSTQYRNNVNVPQFDAPGVPNPYYQIQFTDGYIKRFLADSAVYQVPSPVTLTASNIVSAALNPLYQAVAQNNRALLANDSMRSRMKFMCSYNTSLIYEDYLTTQPFKGNDPTKPGLSEWKGFAIERIAGMPDNTIVFTLADATPESNLWIGLNSISDKNFELMRLFNNSELFFFKMLFKLDVNYGRSEKVFVYTTLTTNSFIQ